MLPQEIQTKLNRLANLNCKELEGLPLTDDESDERVTLRIELHDHLPRNRTGMAEVFEQEIPLED